MDWPLASCRNSSERRRVNADQKADAVVILLSGGVESSTLLYEFSGGSAPIGVFIDYGQRAARRELAAVHAQCRAAGAHLQRLDMVAAGRSFRAGQILSRHVPLPHRNLMILSVGLNYCAQVQAGSLAIGLGREDATADPGSAPRFIREFQRLARILGDVAVVAPFMAKTKAWIIRHGLELGVGYAQTYSCLLGYPRHCGRCPQCRKRRAAFAAAGAPEPPDFYRAGD